MNGLSELSFSMEMTLVHACALRAAEEDSGGGAFERLNADEAARSRSETAS